MAAMAAITVVSYSLTASQPDLIQTVLQPELNEGPGCDGMHRWKFGENENEKMKIDSSKVKIGQDKVR